MGQWSIVWDGLIGILQLDPSNEEALDVLMQIYINETRDVSAFRTWASSHIATHRQDPTVLRRLAAALCANSDLSTRTPDLALEAAKAAYDNSQQRDPISTVVYARAVYQIGDLDRAIGLQKEALVLADGDSRKIVQGALDYYLTCKQLRESTQ